MYVYMNAIACVYMYVYVCVCMYVHMYVNKHLCISCENTFGVKKGMAKQSRIIHESECLKVVAASFRHQVG